MFCCCYYLFLLVGLFSVGSFIYSLAKGIYRNLFRKSLDFGQRYGKGSWAFVTGATSGIGLAMCKDLAARGLNIVLAGRSKERLEAAEKEVKASCKDVQTRCVLVDLNESMEISYFDKIFDQVKDLDISILINNAGVDKNDLIYFKDGKEILETNVYGVCLLTFTFLNKLNSRNKRSALINVASIAGVSPMPTYTVYSSSKVYVRYLTECIAEERVDNIDVMCLSPGFVTTKMTLYKKGFDACSPETTARNTFRDLGQEKETNGFWNHEVSHFLLSIVFRFFPSLFYKIIMKVAGNLLTERLDLMKNNKTYS